MQPQYKAADPISTFLFSICALGSTAPTLRDVLRVLMEGEPDDAAFLHPLHRALPDPTPGLGTPLSSEECVGRRLIAGRRIEGWGELWGSG